MMTAEKDYGVEVISAYGNFRVGQIIYPPSAYRDRLVMTGTVRRRTAADENPNKSINQSKPKLALR